jgi:cysteinyl-tRNA synthetase
MANSADLERAKSLKPLPAIVDALADDLNTHAALQGLNELANHAQWDELAANLVFLGFYTFEDLIERFNNLKEAVASLESWKLKFESEREQAKATKDFSRVDQLRNDLLGVGVEVKIGKEGVQLTPLPSFDADLLKDLEQ